MLLAENGISRRFSDLMEQGICERYLFSVRIFGDFENMNKSFADYADNADFARKIWWFKIYYVLLHIITVKMRVIR